MMQANLMSSASRGAAWPAALAPPADFEARALAAANLLKALAHPDRLLLLCQMVGAERSVSELGRRARIEQPSLSQQLAVLRGERLVATRREGKSVLYRIASPSALTLLQTLYGLFCEGPAPVMKPAATGRAALRRKVLE